MKPNCQVARKILVFGLCGISRTNRTPIFFLLHLSTPAPHGFFKNDIWVCEKRRSRFSHTQNLTLQAGKSPDSRLWKSHTWHPIWSAKKPETKV